MALPGIYVSIPFCAQKCTYCNFRSDVYSRALRAEYLRCLASELREAALTRAETLYLGGGSPSLLEPEEFEALTRALPSHSWREATIEVAPGEATPQRIAAWSRAGINRVSFGVQSFVPEVARAAGRKHDGETVRTELERLAAVGIVNISMDLIAGLARQTWATWQQSLAWLEQLGPDHVSVYMLESDDDSRLGRELRSGGSRYGASEVPADDLMLDLYLHALERLQDLGYERYEVSNFARPGAESAHNLKYWQMEPYFGFGSDAHSFDGEFRWSNAGSAPEYVDRLNHGSPARVSTERLDSERLLEDRVLTGLRTREGVQCSASEWERLRVNAAALNERGWLVAEGARLRLTDSGLLFADQAIAELLG
ncbi:MAG: coproporphyrinogen-III oxidase family protein [Bryobacterales bacterium]|nr:coproporphyrinogen-III oxidase family protein [Bryobacterales bacterium]